jgi:hypothetical protein
MLFSSQLHHMTLARREPLLAQPLTGEPISLMFGGFAFAAFASSYGDYASPSAPQRCTLALALSRLFCTVTRRSVRVTALAC